MQITRVKSLWKSLKPNHPPPVFATSTPLTPPITQIPQNKLYLQLWPRGLCTNLRIFTSAFQRPSPHVLCSHAYYPPSQVQLASPPPPLQSSPHSQLAPGNPPPPSFAQVYFPFPTLNLCPHLPPLPPLHHRHLLGRASRRRLRIRLLRITTSDGRPTINE